MNVLLGIPAIVPLFLAWYILANWPLADLGWTQPEPTENDGMAGWLILATPVFCMFGSIWGFINVWMRRRTAVRASRYWLACVAALLVPFTCLALLDIVGK
ncbi:hypothetical protein [Krasilnikovia cinnamomea]|uniref:hypothetical protein n=1 Tax=Krasilnikovia cinnamomea TaxID=349313 RepID=UPI001F5F2397|nr:hypothetical protein [Krasilnikovia cinnamomea]